MLQHAAAAAAAAAAQRGRTHDQTIFSNFSLVVLRGDISINYCNNSVLFLKHI
jgi:hypothetical protein